MSKEAEVRTGQVWKSSKNAKEVKFIQILEQAVDGRWIYRGYAKQMWTDEAGIKRTWTDEEGKSRRFPKQTPISIKTLRSQYEPLSEKDKDEVDKKNKQSWQPSTKGMEDEEDEDEDKGGSCIEAEKGLSSLKLEKDERMRLGELLVCTQQTLDGMTEKFKKEMKEEIKEMKKDIQVARTEMKEELRELKKEIQAVKTGTGVQVAHVVELLKKNGFVE